MTSAPKRAAAILGVIVIAALALVFLTARPGNRAAEQPRHATVLPERLPLPAFELRDHRGEPFTRDSLAGHSSLLFFGFTHCPDICPATLTQLAAARSRVAEETGLPAEALPEIVLISVDPERDTPDALRRYVEYFGTGITGVTGDAGEIEQLTSALGIYHEKAETATGDYTVNHSTAVLVVDDDASLMALFSAPHKPEYFARDLPLLMAAQ